MSTPVPGQRMAQRPLQAMVRSQAALGRSAAAAGSLTESMILNVGGEWKRVATRADGTDHLEPYTLGQDEKE